MTKSADVALSAGLIAGISVPDSPLVVDALEYAHRLCEACCRLVTARPETSSDNFLRDFGERFVPGYKPMSTVDLLVNAPFVE